MLDILNRYAHGFVAMPIIMACQKQGLFDQLKEEKALSANQLVKKLDANSGHLQVALRLFESIQWIDKNSESNYFLTEKYKKLNPVSLLIYEIMYFPMRDYINNQSQQGLKHSIDSFKKQWPCIDNILVDFIDGLWILPLWLQLKQQRAVNKDNKTIKFSNSSKYIQQELEEIFIERGWAEKRSDDPLVYLTHTGNFLYDRIDITAIVVSYSPMLQQAHSLLFGNPKTVFMRNKEGHETHVERRLNVKGSSFQHQKYFTDMEALITPIFNQPDLSTQPDYIADMGCGDGSLLKRIYQCIKTKTARGKALANYPLTLIGVDNNEKALHEAAITLEGIPYQVLKGDIGNPQKLLLDFEAHKIDPDKILHIRSFLDHDRPFIPAEQSFNIQDRNRLPYTGVYVDDDGKSITPSSAVQSLVEHLSRWRHCINDHGLIVLEVHCLEPQIVATHLDTNESLHFDAYHSFSKQYLVEADVFLMSAAEAGLFPNVETVVKYPKTLPITSVTLTHFQPRSYCIRHARQDDIEALVALEQLCWDEPLQASAAMISERIRIYPYGHCIIERDNHIVGVIYTQRIHDVQGLYDTDYSCITDLHCSDGSIFQLIAISTHPDLHSMGLGDQLLNFTLCRARVQNNVETVVAVTRCKDYLTHKHLSLCEYIHTKDEQGRLIDPILRFHQHHGAQIEQLVPAYRPDDVANAGNGVLIRYDIDQQVKPVTTDENPTPVLVDRVSITQAVKHAITHLLNRPVTTFELSQPLMEMGLDSVALLDLRILLGQQFTENIDPVFFFQYRTAEAIIDYFAQKNKSASEASTQNIAQHIVDTHVVANAVNIDENTLPKHHSNGKPTTDIAIVGTACRFPMAATLEQFWQLLTTQQSAINQWPGWRWQWPHDIDLQGGGQAVQWGGFIEDIARFDAEFFGLTASEAEMMDPQQRILLELSWELLESAGYNPMILREQAIGIYIGACHFEYNELLEQKLGSALTYYSGLEKPSSNIANYLSHFYDFIGPSLTIDTACSSSLVALHEAVKAIKTGESKQAIAGGVNLLCNSINSITYNQAGMLSPDGLCKTFDKTANGYVRGEGAGLVLLKSLNQAIKDNNQILAIVKATAINHGGEASSLTAPNPDAQAQLLIKAYQCADIPIESVNYIETHGTGTSLGDPIEIQGLKQAFKQLANNHSPSLATFCGLGSVKTNIGHLESAAGIAGLIKVLLCMQHKALPANLNFHQLNPYIDLTDSPFYIVDKAKEWKQTKNESGHLYPRRAGISSFGFGGANAHVVVEEYHQEKPFIQQNIENETSQLIILSAKTQDRLYVMAKNLSIYLANNEEQSLERLIDIAYTLQTARHAMTVRVAFIVSTIEDLQKDLKNYVSGTTTQTEIYKSYVHDYNQPRVNNLSEVKPNQSYIHSAINQKDYPILAQIWVNGVDIDWSNLWEDYKPHCIRLPTYPFSQERYWVPLVNSVRKQRLREV